MANQKSIIQKSSLDFLKAVGENNNREWFANNKDKYSDAHNNIIAFADELLAEMNSHDKIETLSGKDSMHRIYKDVRFSKDKTPYNSHFGMSFKRATKQLRGGYYLHIAPGNSFAEGGFWGPNTDDIKRIRQDIDLNYFDWQELLKNKLLVENFGSMIGEKLTSAPRGYAKDHPAIELLRYKQFLFTRHFTDAEVYSTKFAKMVSDTFKNMRPFYDFMSEVLTTDINGVPYED